VRALLSPLISIAIFWQLTHSPLRAMLVTAVFVALGLVPVVVRVVRARRRTGSGARRS
jgi:hypothetical protein